MKVTEIVKEIKDRGGEAELIKKRVACAGCGSTWIEFVGSVVGHKEGLEDLSLRIGFESENCQTCRHRPLECPKCASKDVYEIPFAERVPDTSLNFKGITKVSRT